MVVGGRLALSLLAERMYLWQVPWRWHFVAWLSPFVLLGAAIVVDGAISGATSPHVFEQSPEFAELPLAVYWIAVLLFYGFGEEIGWRGFALPVLQGRFPPVVATLIVSVIWATWHLPLFWFSPGLSSLGIGGIVGWFLSLLTGAFILTWLTNSTRGSILLAAAFHATMDVAFSPSISPLATMLIGGAVTVWGVGVLIYLLLTLDARGMVVPVGEPSKYARLALLNGEPL